MIQKLAFNGSLQNRPQLADRLAATGLSQEACLALGDLFARAAEAINALPSGKQVTLQAFFVPGRIEVLGKHTDYAGGSSLVTAVEQGFCLVLLPRQDRQVRIVDAVGNQTVQFNLEPNLVPRVGDWSNYPLTVGRRLARNFPGACCGADIAFASNLPPAAGLSSSSALIVAIFLALAEVNQLAGRPEYHGNIKDQLDLAGYLGTIENGQTFGSLEGDRGVGTFGGSEDHTAILTAQPDHISQYAYCPVRWQRYIQLPARFTFAVGASGVMAEKTGTALEKYNAASRRAAALANIWNRNTGRRDPHLAAILASGAGAAGELAGMVRSAIRDPTECGLLLARLNHFRAENQDILPAAGDALTRGDLKTFGDLVDRSQEGAEKLLGNQVPETMFMARSARRCGAVAASAFGAGFGGSVWALVEKERAGSFLHNWAEDYRSQFPQHGATSIFFRSGAGPGAFQFK